jgi:hypothetical protein
MDWIERLFGISPDGGSGLTELVIGLALVMALVVCAVGTNLFGVRTATRRWSSKR